MLSMVCINSSCTTHLMSNEANNFWSGDTSVISINVYHEECDYVCMHIYVFQTQHAAAFLFFRVVVYYIYIFDESLAYSIHKIFRI